MLDSPFTRTSALAKIDLTPSPHVAHTTLIGTSEERQSLLLEQEEVFLASLEADKQKHLTEVEQQRLSELMNTRKQRVVDEPFLDESHVTINVRHVTLGIKIRLFRDGALFSQVYDWIGSISIHPEFYKILDYQGKAMDPNSSVTSGVFNMLQMDEPILMLPEVAFKGFGVAPHNNSFQNDDEEINDDKEYNTIQRW